MKNFIQDGERVEVTAPSGGVVSGEGYIIGDGLFVVAEHDAAVDEKFTGRRKGVVELTRNAGTVFDEGDAVAWDDSAKELVAPGTGKYNIGMMAEDYPAAAGVAKVILDGAATVIGP